MAIRTALGTAKLKADGTNLPLLSVSLSAGDCLIVGVCFQQQNLPSSVKWGVKDLIKAVSQINSISGHGAAFYVIRSVVNADIRDLNVDWASAIGARALFALKLNAASIRDQIDVSVPTGSTAPSVGPTPVLDYYNDFAITIMAAQGPSSDIAPTVTGWTVGQTDGTVGVPPVSNITIHEFYQQKTNDNSAVTCSGTGATERDWACCVLTLRDILVIPYLDANGVELAVGDTVSYQGVESTISSFIREKGIPVVFCVLADGRVLYTYLVELVK